MSHESEPMIDGRIIGEMKVVELKEELGKRGLSKIGNKNVLVERLKEFLSEEISATDEGEKQILPESPTRELTSPPNPFVAEYLAKQQTALREARKDAEAVRRASSCEDMSPVPEKATPLRRSRRGRQDSGVEKNETQEHKEVVELEAAAVSETEQLQQQVLQEATTTTTSADEQKEEQETVPTEVTEKITETDVATVTVEPLQTETEEIARVVADPVSQNESQTADEAEEDVGEGKEDTLSEGASAGGADDIASSNEQSDNEEEPLEQETFETAEDMEEKIVIEAEETVPITETMKSIEDHPVKLQEDDEKLDEKSEQPSAKKIKIIDHSGGVEESGKISQTSSERKRRWKTSSSTSDQGKVNVVRVSLKENANVEVEVHESKDKGSIVEASDSVAELKDVMTESKDKLEELDYEEPVQPISVANNELEVKHSHSSHKKEDAHERRPKHPDPKDERAHARSKTPEKRKPDNITVDGFVRARSVSPARYPVNQVIMIRQLTRPFTVKQLQRLLGTFGTVVSGGFWIDNIKSTCMAKYSSVEEAVIARGRLHNIVWPTCSPKMLKVDYSDDASLDKRMNGDKAQNGERNKADADAEQSRHTSKKSHAENTNESLRVSVNVDHSKRQVQPLDHEKAKERRESDRKHESDHDSRKRKRSSSPGEHKSDKRARDRRSSPWRDERRRQYSPESRGRGVPHQPEPEKKVKTADELFLKTKTQPAIYYLPLTEEEIMDRKKRKAAEAEQAKKQATQSASSSSSSKQKEKDGGGSASSKETGRGAAQTAATTSSVTRKQSPPPPSHSSRRRSHSPRDRKYSRSPRRRR